MPDYYNILGISKSATDDEIKNAYRKLARTHHPDKGGDKNKFQQIQEAYETLSDVNKRRNYDNPPQQHNFDHMFPFEFNNHPFFRQNRGQEKIKKNDYIYNCNLSLNEVYTGVQKKFRVQRTKQCQNCKRLCDNCNGQGHIIQHMQMGPFSQTIQQQCSVCKGSGQNNNENNGNCEICNNKGSITEEKIFEVNIKPGVESGTKITFEEWGEQATRSNEISGSFVVNITINDHPDFKRRGLHLVYNVKTSLRDSIIGKTIIIPHFAEPITLNTSGFGVINPNKEYILYKKGLINETGQQGDMYIRFIVEYTDCNFNEEQIDLLQSTFDKVGFT